MVTTSTPNWSAARNGLPGDTTAVNHAAQVNQFLGTHGITAIYQGNQILTPSGTGATFWPLNLGTTNYDQPFTMSGTTIGRIMVPMLPVGNGADLQVSLYTDASGSPGTLVNTVRIPATWIREFAAVVGTDNGGGANPALTLTGNPLATSLFNTVRLGNLTTTPWASSITSSCSTALYNNVMFCLGGINAGATANLPTVTSSSFDAAGNAGHTIPQPPLPVAISQGTAVASVDPSSGAVTVFYIGGTTNFATSAPGSAVYASQYNVGTGSLANWTQQAALPQAVDSCTAATWNGYVYVVGGITGFSPLTLTGNVYYAQVVNSQITAWVTGPTMPVGSDSQWCVAIDGYLIVSAAGPPPNAIFTYYAAIHADGSLGPWQMGPNNPYTSYNAGGVAQPGLALGNVGVFFGASGGTAQPLMIGVSSGGLDVEWVESSLVVVGSPNITVPVSGGLWYWYGDAGASSITGFINSAFMWLTPRISVPLPTSGLSNGSTYHVVLTQQGGDLNDYLMCGTDTSALPANALQQSRAGGSWSTYSSGQAIPISVYDETPGGNAWHFWEDNGAKISTLVYATALTLAPLLGIAEATAFPAVQNANQTFATGVSPWTATGGTITQSNAQTHGGFAFSGLLTPSGTGNALALTEHLAVTAGTQCTMSVWLYSTTGWATTQVQITWYDVGNTNLGAYTTTVNLASATWGFVTTGVAVAPANTAYAIVNVGETGSPTATNLLYLSNPIFTTTPGMYSTVTSLTYGNDANGWPHLTQATQLV